MSHLTDRLKHIGATQEELSYMLDVSQRTISGWISGRVTPTPKANRGLLNFFKEFDENKQDLCWLRKTALRKQQKDLLHRLMQVRTLAAEADNEDIGQGR